MTKKECYFFGLAHFIVGGLILAFGTDFSLGFSQVVGLPIYLTLSFFVGGK